MAADKPAFTTIWNPVNGLPWECPNDEESLDYYLNVKGFTKEAPAKAAPTGKKESTNG